jgi:hypothetical protein
MVPIIIVKTGCHAHGHANQQPHTLLEHLGQASSRCGSHQEISLQSLLEISCITEKIPPSKISAAPELDTGVQFRFGGKEIH